MNDLGLIKKQVDKAYKDYKKEKTMNLLKERYSWVIIIFIISIIMIPVAIVILLYYELEGRRVGLYYTDLCLEYKELANKKFFSKYKEIINKEKYDYSYFMKYYYYKKYNIDILGFIKERDCESIYKMINDDNYFESVVYDYLSKASMNYDIFNLYLEIDYFIESNQLMLLNTEKINYLKEKLLLMDINQKNEFFKFKYGELKYNRIIDA